MPSPRLLRHACTAAALAFAATATAAPWSNDGSLITARFYHTSTLLPDGRVLVVGGSGGALAEIYDPVRRTATATALLQQGRGLHTATLLRDGRVLVVGGAQQDSWDTDFDPFASVELYDPHTATWSATSPLGQARANHTATLLPDGRVLVVGGVEGDGAATPTTATPLASAEFYDPQNDTWTAAAPMRLARRSHGATLLADGSVLVSGGRDESDPTGRSAERFDPAANTWTDTSDTIAGTDPVQRIASRYLHTATATADGAVLSMGGLTSASSIDRYVADSDTWNSAGGLPQAYDHAASLLPSGAVLVNGGYAGAYLGATLSLLPDGDTVTYSTEAPLATPRAAHVATLLADGRVLVTGGAMQAGSGMAASVESFDPAVALFAPAQSLATPRERFTATSLRDGRVLLVGGSNGASGLASAELHDPATGTSSPVASMHATRVDHAAALLPDGRVLVVGGRSGPAANDAIAQAEIYDPQANTWSDAGDPASVGASARHGHSATLLPDGSVLVAGGSNATGVAGGDFGLLTAARFLPATDTWIAAGTLPDEKSGHAALLLPTGDVLLLGGRSRNGAIGGGTPRYRPSTGAWGTSGLIIQRTGIATSFLADGRVLITGGSDGAGPSSAACVWDWQPLNGIENPCMGAPALNLAAARTGHSTTLLPDGRVLVAGGRDAAGALAEAELLQAPRTHPFNDADTAVWRATAALPSARSEHRAALLPDGTVALFGGVDAAGTVQASVFVFDADRTPDATRAPQLDAVPGTLFKDGALTLGGSGFRPWLEGSSGNTKASTSNHPVVQVQRVGDGRSRYLGWWPAQPPADGSYVAAPGALDGFHAGLAYVRVWVNGIPSQARPVMLDVSRYGVTASAVGNGSIDPSGTQAVQDNGSAVFTLSPGAGENIDHIAGDCPIGTPVANGDGTFGLTVGPVTASCDVVVQFGTVHAIDVTTAPASGGTATCAPNPVTHGGTATCTANANPGYSFTGWSGACSGTTCTLANVTAPRSVTAHFTRITHPITVTVLPTGAGSASCTPNPVPHGDDAVCTATAMSGYSFDGWSGACSGASCVLDDMTTAASVNASFSALPLPPVELSLHAMLDAPADPRPGTLVGLTLTLRNDGDTAAVDAHLAWIPAHWIDIEWTCAATPPASCTPSGTGGIDDAGIDVPAHGELTWLVTARIAAGAPGQVVNQATVEPGPDQVDTDPADNTATWTLQIVPIFADGFED